MRIGIVGAGAIGGWMGVRLARAGHTVSVLARGTTLAALHTAPWRLETGGGVLEATVRASADAAVLGPQDVLVIALKGPALTQVAAALSPMIAPGTEIVTAMNGVPWWFLLAGGGRLGPTRLDCIDPGGVIEAALPCAQLVGGVVHCSALSVAPGVVRHKAGNRLILGDADGAPRAAPRLTQAASAFEAAGFDVERSPHVQRDIWYKLWGNMTMNPISAVTGATCDRILDDPPVSAFVLRVMREAQAIGAEIGLSIGERGEDRNQVTRRLGAFKTSMLQDAEAGRPIELDQLLGAPMEIARHLGMPTPNLDALYGLTRLFARTHGLYPC